MEPRVWYATVEISQRGNILSCQEKRRMKVHCKNRGNVGGGVVSKEDAGEHIGINSVGKGGRLGEGGMCW